MAYLWLRLRKFLYATTFRRSKWDFLMHVFPNTISHQYRLYWVGSQELSLYLISVSYQLTRKTTGNLPAFSYQRWLLKSNLHGLHVELIKRETFVHVKSIMISPTPTHKSSANWSEPWFKGKCNLWPSMLKIFIRIFEISELFIVCSL